MSAEVVRLPTAASSFYRVRRKDGAWRVELVTPGQGGHQVLVSVLTVTPSLATAIRVAKMLGADMQRPVMLPQGVAP